jgi:MutS-like protein
VPWNPQEEYHARLTARRTAHDRLTRVDARCAHARVATFFSAVLLALLAWRSGFSPWLLIFPVVVFAWLVWYHARVLRSRELATRAIRFYEHGLARLDDRWVGSGETGERFRNDDHVYANDLDLFGHGSLFELLSIARTRTGEAHLAEWLLAPADAPEIQERQHAVEELAPELDLREQLALIGADVDRTVQTDRLIDWAGSAVPSGRTLRLVTRVAAAFMVFSSAYLVFTGAWRPLSLVILCQTLALRIFRDDIDAMLSAREPGAAAGFVADILLHRSRDS